MRTTLLQARVNSVIALMFVGTCAFCAGLIIWHAAFGENPLASALSQSIMQQADW